MNLKKHLLSLTISIFFIFIFLTPTIYAQNPVIGTISPPPQLRATQLTDTTTIISVIIKLFVTVAGLFSLWQFLTAGFAYITSNGDKGKISQATSKLNMAIIGLVLVGSSLVITGILSWALFGSPVKILFPQLVTI